MVKCGGPRYGTVGVAVEAVNHAMRTNVRGIATDAPFIRGHQLSFTEMQTSPPRPSNTLCLPSPSEHRPPQRHFDFHKMLP